MKPALVFALLASLATPLAAADITVHGSTTMQDLNQNLATAFSAANPTIHVTVTASDSAAGIAELIAGKTDIAASSRQIKPEEAKKLAAAAKSVVALPVARDGIVVYVNNANGVSSLTMEQLAAIYTGAITNWKQVGGADAPIAVYVRETSSGTHAYFAEHVLAGKPYVAGAKQVNSSSAVVAAVAKDRNAIGYAGAVVSRSAKPLSIKTDASSAAVMPDRASVVAGTYPISRILYYYLGKTPAGDLLKFTQWVLSPAGQQIVAKAGYFPVR